MSFTYQFEGQNKDEGNIKSRLQNVNYFELDLFYNFRNKKYQIHMSSLKEGSKAPAFKGTDEQGNTIALKDYKGKKLVLFFYPKDNTPTCTTEVCNLRDNYSALQKEGYELVGVSADSAKKHQNFIKKFDLPFPLIADTETEIIKSYGVWGEKQMFGKKYEGIFRTTFVIDEKGKIEKIIDKVKAKDHAAQILDN